MTENSQKDQQNFARRLALPGQTRKTPNKGKAAASFSQTASVPAEALPPAVSQPQKNIQRFCIGLPDAPFFISRDKFYASNLQYLAVDLAEKRWQILSGMIGCGKTALARQYASQNFQGQQGESPDKCYTSVFWLDATKGAPEETLELTFKMQMEHQPGQSWLKEFAEKLRAYEADLAKNEYWLLVIDGCDEPLYSDEPLYFDEPLYVQEYLDLAKYLRENTQRGHLILTTRRIPDSTQDISYVVREIENMAQETDEARELLLDAYFSKPVAQVRAEEPGSVLLRNEAEMLAATQLVAELWYNPLLICTLGKYMHDVQKTPSYLLPLLPQEIIQDPFGAKQNNDPFSTIFITSLIKILRKDHDFIHKDSPVSYQILMLCAFLSGGRIPRRLIDFRPASDSTSPFYESRATQPDEHIRPLRRVGFLKHDEDDNTFFHLNLIIRTMVHLKFQTPTTATAAERKVSENNLRQHQIYAIHTVSTVFLGLDDISSKYDDYQLHIRQCIKYLEENAIQEYIRGDKSLLFMLDTVFRFLATVGHYLRQHPQNEGIYSLSEIADAGEKVLEMRATHLFKLALQIYHFWSPLEQDQPERKQILHKMLPTLHEHFLYEQNRPELEKIEGYYPALQDLVTGDDESIRIHYDLGCLKSDLNDFAGAESQFNRLYEKLTDFCSTADESQKSIIIRWQAEILASQATNLLRKASHQTKNPNSNVINTTDNSSNNFMAAKDTYGKIEPLLKQYGSNANGSEEMRQRVKYLEERYQIGEVIARLFTSSSPASADSTYDLPSREQVEKYRDLLEQKISAIAPSKEVPYLTYLQLVVDLSNLAEVYRRLGEEEEQKGVPLHKIPYFAYSKDYSLCALTCYDYFYQKYPEKHLQVQVILQTAWANYEENPLYEVNKNKTPTRMLRDLEKRYRKI